VAVVVRTFMHRLVVQLLDAFTMNFKMSVPYTKTYSVSQHANIVSKRKATCSNVTAAALR